MWTQEPSTLVSVDVTFLRMEHPPQGGPPPIGAGVVAHRVRPRCAVARYRRLYAGVGHDYLWWLRRTLSDVELDDVLANRAITVDVLLKGQEELGFFELDRRGWPNINLAYFGLMPGAIGLGLGMAFLRHAVHAAWDEGCTSLTVNTCTADHPRALPNYIRAGFKVLRTVREDWPIPDRLGLPIPDHLRV